MGASQIHDARWILWTLVRTDVAAYEKSFLTVCGLVTETGLNGIGTLLVRVRGNPDLFIGRNAE